VLLNSLVLVQLKTKSDIRIVYVPHIFKILRFDRVFGPVVWCGSVLSNLRVVPLANDFQWLVVKVAIRVFVRVLVSILTKSSDLWLLLRPERVIIQVDQHFLVRLPINFYFEHDLVHLPWEQEKAHFRLFLCVIHQIQQRTHCDIVRQVMMAEAASRQVHPRPVPQCHNFFHWVLLRRPTVQGFYILNHKSFEPLFATIVYLAIVTYLLKNIVVSSLQLA